MLLEPQYRGRIAEESAEESCRAEAGRHFGHGAQPNVRDASVHNSTDFVGDTNAPVRRK